MQSCVTPAEAIDTGTAGGRLVFHIFGSIAEFERAIVRERTKAGVIAAKARGRAGGRPAKLTGERAEHAHNLLNAGTTVSAVARSMGSAGQPFIARWSGLPKQRNKDLMQGPRMKPSKS